MPDKYTNIGTKISLSEDLPTTEDAAGYGALTFTQVKGVATVPEIGPSSSVVSQADLEDGVVLKGHGEVDYGGGSVAYRVINGDAGQDMVKAAFDGQSVISAKITRSTGLIEYCKVIFMGYRTAESSTGNFYSVSSDMQVTSKIIEDATGV